ncbi:MAG: hypothetical protein ACRBBP_07685 [Bdellovibrionales bacterium]
MKILLFERMKWKLFFIFLMPYLSGCNTSVTDAVFGNESFFSKSNSAKIELLENTTQESQQYCANSSVVKLKVSFPKENNYLCSDRSTLGGDQGLGPICDGGVSVMDFPVDSGWRPCSEVRVCGLPPTSRTTTGSRFDGGGIEELTFENLPWGCEAKIVYGTQEEIDAKKDATTSFFVKTPECPFCPTQNMKTCLPCDSLGADEEIKAGQVVNTTCTGGACASCDVGGGEMINHGEPYTFYNRSSSQCGSSCNVSSQVRICNNGFFEGEPAYQHKQCVDVPCGCQLSGTSLTYDSGKILKLYKETAIQCGITCSNIDVRCDNGDWKYTSDGAVVPANVLSVHNKETCSAQNTCKCTIPVTNAGFIKAGRYRYMHKIQGSTCEEENACSEEANRVKVNCSVDGVIDSFDAGAFQYTYCSRPRCTCYHGGERVDVNATVHFYKEEIAPEGVSCANISSEFTCLEGGNFQGGANLSEYPYAACQSETDSGTLGGAGGGTGNDDGPGSALKSKFGLGDGGGGSGLCADGTKCRQDFTKTDFLKPKKSACALPWGNGEVGHYGSIIAFDRTCVVTPGKCSQYRQSRTCGVNGLTGSATFIHETCEEKASCP